MTGGARGADNRDMVNARAAWRSTARALIALAAACGGPDEHREGLDSGDAPVGDALPFDARLADTSWIDATPPLLEVVDLGVGTGTPTALAIDATHVFWTDGATIYRKALDGTGARLAIATHALPAGNTGPAIGELDVDATYVYFLANGTQPASGGAPPQLMRRPKDGSGVSEVLLAMPGGADAQLASLRARATGDIYVSARQPHAGGVYRVRAGSPAPTTPLPATTAGGIDAPGYVGRVAISGTTLITTGFEEAPTGEPGIIACELPACAARAAIASYADAGGDGLAPPTPRLAADATQAYWTAGASLASARLIGGGDALVLTTVPGAALGDLVVDDGAATVWFAVTGPDGAIRKAWKGLERQAPIAVAEHQQSPLGLRMDATHLYWAEGGSKTIWRIGR